MFKKRDESAWQEVGSPTKSVLQCHPHLLSPGLEPQPAGPRSRCSLPPLAPKGGCNTSALCPFTLFFPRDLMMQAQALELLGSNLGLSYSTFMRLSFPTWEQVQ